MEMRYDQDLNHREIGQIMGISESRVSQLYGQAIERIQKRLDYEM
jgi:RNA polymerase sigma factor for flagellar operon FliA